MEIYRIENLSFKYPGGDAYVLKDIDLSIKAGEFLTICGPSGSGKSSFLRQLKPILAPHGDRTGRIYFKSKDIVDLDKREEAAKIGYVLQNPENQIVTDKVWHELAFGLESLGYENELIRLRVGEMASFFGIQNWFHKNTRELSGGQKQILNLGSIMAMQPDVLILDEPTSQLDPIAATDFLNTLRRINLELGVTIIITEHRLEELIPMTDRLLVFSGGKIIADSTPKVVGKKLKDMDHPMFKSMTASMQIYGELENGEDYPITVRDGRNFLEARLKELPSQEIEEEAQAGEDIIELRDVWFRYSKKSDDVVKGLDLSVRENEFLAIVGGNGTGKTTSLSLISRLNKYYRGSIKIMGERLEKIPDKRLYGDLLGILPQNPENLFVKPSVAEDLLEIFKYEKDMDLKEKEARVYEMAKKMEIEDLLDRHPYDLSGGEKQRMGLGKILLQEPKILLLDEPTKGMDDFFKEKFGQIVEGLKDDGVTILMVSHDIEFCARYADRCALFFNGDIISINTRRKFFAGNNFYTTAANRIARGLSRQAITVEDVVELWKNQKN